MASNTSEESVKFRDRLIALKEEQHRVAQDIKEVGVEMKKASALTKVAIAGIKLAVRHHFEEPEKREFRESAEAFAESLGQLQDTPLGNAALRAVR